MQYEYSDSLDVGDVGAPSALLRLAFRKTALKHAVSSLRGFFPQVVVLPHASDAVILFVPVHMWRAASTDEEEVDEETSQ